MKIKEPTPRELALELLLAVTSKKAYSHIALREAMEKYAYLGHQKLAQLRRLFMGTLEHLIELDYIINLFAKTKTERMKPQILNILRMGVYELKYMDGVPESAAVNEAVKLAEKKGFRNLKGFVNGVLRSVSRALPSLTLPEDLSVRYSMPPWIAELWTHEYGREKAEEIMKGFEGERPLTVHINRCAMPENELLTLWEREGASYEETVLPGAYRLKLQGGLTEMESFRRGGFFVQDLSSMEALSSLPLKENMRILDLCGAPGGKSMFLSEALLGKAEIICRDLSPAKLPRMEENFVRCGFSNIRPEIRDALCPDPEHTLWADAVIADLPCSGLGVLSRKPDIKLRQTPEGAEELAALQRSILHIAADYVKSGGYLLQSTCTIHRAENEDNTEAFRKEHPDFSLIESRQLFPEAGIRDGFYYALFRKL